MAHIIIAEDDEIVASVAQMTLSEEGHAVGVVSNGENAWHAIRSRRPDLVILDCNMPGLSGVSVLAKIRTDNEIFALPVIMLTARSSERDKAIALQAGANEYLTKPLDRDELAAAVELVLFKVQARSWKNVAKQ